MSAFYEDMQKTATELLTEFNQGNIEYVQLEQLAGAEPWEPTQTVTETYPVEGVTRGVETKYLTDLITQSDIQVTIAVFDAVPNKDSIIKLDGVERQIISIQLIPATGVTVAYRIFVKG